MLMMLIMMLVLDNGGGDHNDDCGDGDNEHLCMIHVLSNT